MSGTGDQNNKVKQHIPQLCSRGTYKTSRWKNFWTHQQPTIKKFEPPNTQELPTNYPREKISNPRNTHKEDFGLTKYPKEKILDPRNTQEKNVRPTKNPREKILNPRRYGDTMTQ